jgi:predicted nucleic acid-binding protein
VTVILDASATLGWLLHELDSDARDTVRGVVAAGSALVPELWLWEIANALVVAERRGRITAQIRRQIAAGVDKLPVLRAPLRDGVAALTELASSSGLSAYDASYLDLALSHGASLCSTDSRLVEAARSRGVVCVLDA